MTSFFVMVAVGWGIGWVIRHRLLPYYAQRRAGRSDDR